MIDVTDLESLAVRCAPELGSTPLYLVHAPADHPSTRCASAFALQTDMPSMREHLIEMGLWCGPGNIVCYCDLTMPGLEGLTIHELGHLLPARAPREDIPPTAEALAHEKELLAALRDTPAPEVDYLPPWWQHEGSYIRRTLHLWHRARSHGHDIHAAELCIAGRHYGLSTVAHYIRALGDEPARMAHCSFAEIEATLPPPEFTLLFELDKVRHSKHKENQCHK